MLYSREAAFPVAHRVASRHARLTDAKHDIAVVHPERTRSSGLRLRMRDIRNRGAPDYLPDPPREIYAAVHGTHGPELLRLRDTLA